MTQRGQRQYRMLGLNVSVAGSDAVLETMHGRLRYFAEAPGPAPDLSVEFVSLGPGDSPPIARPDGHGRPLGPSPDEGFESAYFPDSDQLFARVGDRVLLLCDVGAARAVVSIAAPEAENLWLATHPMFVLALFELLKAHRYFNVHAAALSVDGAGILLAGHSGSGKSTLALALCRVGFDFLSDDYVFLTGTPAGLRMLGFPEELDLRDDTVALFPDLAPLLPPAPRPGWSKRQVRVEQYRPVRIVREAAPVLLLFPSVAHSAVSRIEPVTARDALAELVANLQFTRPEPAQAHLDLLADLVRRCARYRLHTGRDFERLAVEIRTLVAAVEGRPGVV